MELTGAIAQTQTDIPKIKVTSFGAEITLEVADVSIDALRGLCGETLKIRLEKE